MLLFFVHTSLVLMMSLERQIDKLGDEHTWFRFMLRRVFRIYPLSILVVVITVGLQLPNSNPTLHSMIYVPISKMAFVSNLLLVQNLTYSPSAPGPLWSLPFEMQMYCLLPLLFMVATRARRFATILLLWGAAVAVALVQPSLPYAGRLNVVQFGPCFIPGVIAFFLLLNHKKGFRLPAAAWLFTVPALVGLYSLSPRRSWVFQWCLCLATGLLIPFFAEIQNSLLRKGSHLLAKYSYGIYLCHPACLYLAFVLLKGWPGYIQWTAFLVLFATIPVTLYHSMEAPLIAFGAKLANPRPKVKVAVAAT